MKIQLSDHFTYGRLMRFTIPSVFMMILASLYGVVDGIFVSNFVGSTAFAAVNLIMPYLIIFSTIGFMAGSGGSALIAKTLGENKKEEANQIFSSIIFILIAVGILFSVISLIFLRQAAELFGAKGEMLDYCVRYGRVILPTLTAYMLQNAFQSLLITAEKPTFGLVVTVAAGVTNMIFDAIFVAGFKMGVEGAAIATLMGQCVGGIIPLVYFAVSKNSIIKIKKTHFKIKPLLKVCTNGSSEFMTNVSFSLVNILYNLQLMRIAGETGVAAYGVIMYVNFIFTGFYFGYSMGCSPIVSYHYGANNHTEMKSLFKKSLVILTVAGVSMTLLAEIFAKPLALIFASYDKDLLNMTVKGFMLYSTSFIFMGYNIFASAFFTALNNGAVSAAISFARTLFFQIVAVLILPLLLGLNGIWLSILAAETFSLIFVIMFFVKYKNRYHYI